MSHNHAIIPGYAFASIGESIVHPLNHANLYHGTCLTDPTDFYGNGGFKLRGKDIDLIRHVEPPPSRIEESAFMGTVNFPVATYGEAGAADWAGSGGWVYHIQQWPGYDVQQLLEGKIPDGKGGFRGPLMREREIAIPAGAPNDHLQKVGDVVEGRRNNCRIAWRQCSDAE